MKVYGATAAVRSFGRALFRDSPDTTARLTLHDLRFSSARKIRTVGD